jgi:hypothetical protein
MTPEVIAACCLRIAQSEQLNPLAAFFRVRAVPHHGLNV